MSVSLGILFLLFAGANALYGPKDGVTVLTASDFHRKVVLSKDLWIVQFYLPQCHICQNLAPEWKKVAVSLKDKVKVGAVNADEQQALVSHYRVEQYPTIKIFAAHKYNSTDYKGDLNAERIVDAALVSLQNMMRIRHSGVSVGGGSGTKIDCEEPPNVKWPLSQEMMIVRKRRPTVYSCEASGNPKPQYQWYRNGQPLYNTSEYVRGYSNGTLYFKEFSSRENGFYHCTATNKHGVSVSQKVPIFAEVLPQKGKSSNKEIYKGKEGDPLNVFCEETPPTIPECIKRWYIEKGPEMVDLSDRVSTDLNGTLRFSYLLKSDANTYVCALVPAVALAGTWMRLYNTVTIRVDSQHYLSYPLSPLLVYSSSDVKAVVGRTAILECFFSRYPVANITWKDNHNLVISSNNSRLELDELYFGRRLVIHRVEDKDAGTFICTADNGFGNAFATIRVNVTGPPMKVPYFGLETLTVPDDEAVILTCKARVVYGQRKETPIWFRNGKLLSADKLPDPTRYSFRSDHTELRIWNLSKQADTACFQCNVSNSEGHLLYDGYLRVIDSIQIVRRPENVIHLKDIKRPVDISVVASGEPCLPIIRQWYLNDVALTSQVLEQRPFVWLDKGSTLLFNASGLDRQTLVSKVGYYTCRVSNLFQEEFVHFRIILHADNESIQVPNPGKEHPKPGKDHQNPREQYPNPDQVYPNPGQGYPNERLGYPNPEQGNPNRGQEHPNQGQEYPNLGQEDPDSCQENPNPGQEHLNPGQEYPNPEQVYLNPGQEHLNPWQGYPNAGQKYPNTGQEYPNPMQRYPILEQGYPNPGQGYPTTEQGYPNPVQGYLDPEQGYPNPGQGYPNTEQENPNSGQGYPNPEKGYPNPGQGFLNPGQGYPNPGQ